MAKRCIVNWADLGNPPGERYLMGQARLNRLCDKYGIPFVAGTGDPPCDYPKHSDVPYAFKAAMIESAIRRGYETVCWMDASACIQHDPSPIFEIAERCGAFISQNYGIKTGKWSTDACLAEFGLTREEAWQIEHCSALVCAFCVTHPIGEAVWNEYSAAARKGTAFRGPHKIAAAPDLFSKWSNQDVEGHRHDQTVLSILAHRYGIPLQPHTFMDYGDQRPDAIVAAIPMPDR